MRRSDASQPATPVAPKERPMREAHEGWERFCMGHGPFGHRPGGGRGDFWTCSASRRSGRSGARCATGARRHRRAAAARLRDHPVHRGAQRRLVPAQPGGDLPTLQMLEELGHARVEERDGRKVYAITPTARRSWPSTPRSLGLLRALRRRRRLGAVRGGPGRPLAPRRQALQASAGRRAAADDATTMKKLRALLDETIAKVETLLDDERR